MRTATAGVALLATVALLVSSASATTAATASAGHASGTFEITSWVEEELVALPEGGKLIHLSATDAFGGGIVGSARAEEEHLVRADGTRDFAGHIVVTGTLAGRTGTFVIRTTGTFDGHAARSHWRVVPGSGTGELRGLRGTGTDVAVVAEAPSVRYRLSYWFRR